MASPIVVQTKPIIRYRNGTRALVIVFEQTDPQPPYGRGYRARCTGCQGHPWEPDDGNDLATTREWAAQHADKCRALPPDGEVRLAPDAVASLREAYQHLRAVLDQGVEGAYQDALELAEQALGMALPVNAHAAAPQHSGADARIPRESAS